MNRKILAYIIYSPNYGAGLWSWNYKKLATYLPLINWLKANEELNEKYDNKLLTEILIGLGIVKRYIEEKIEVYPKRILQIDENKITTDIKTNEGTIEESVIKVEIQKELITALKKYINNKETDPDEIYFLINNELKVEELYPDETIWLKEYDGYEEVVYSNDCYNDELIEVTYEEVKKLNELSLKI